MSLNQALNEQQFPWDDIQAARNDAELQARNSVAQYKVRYQRQLACPQCRCRGEDLAWFHFSSPPWTWREMCGRAGPIVVCDHCQKQVAFFLDMMN